MRYMCPYKHKETEHAPGNTISRPRNVLDVLKETFSLSGKGKYEKRKSRKVTGNGWKSGSLVKQANINIVEAMKGEETSLVCTKKHENGTTLNDYVYPSRRKVFDTGCLSQNEGKDTEMCTRESQECVNGGAETPGHLFDIIEETSQELLKSDVTTDNADEVVALEGEASAKTTMEVNETTDNADDVVALEGEASAKTTMEVNENVPCKIALQLVGLQCDGPAAQEVPLRIDETCTSSFLAGVVDGDAVFPLADFMGANPAKDPTTANNVESIEDTKSSSCLRTTPFSEALLQATNDCFDGKSFPLYASRLDAHSRWKQLKHTLTLVHYMSVNLKSSSKDSLGNSSEVLQIHPSLKQDAGVAGAAAFEGTKTMQQSRLKGRRGMEGLLVHQNKKFMTFIQDFYVACLKMPATLFLLAVFLSPVALGLLFTPFYLFDADGLTFNGVVPEYSTTNPLATGKQYCLAVLNVFLYSLSLSTTFGGSPIAALSPYCLLVANVNTLIAQFLFVFLSGAVFARMSQPSNPIQCSNKAIIKDDDIVLIMGNETQERFKVFCVRLVLTGPSPCEVLDAKICLTFRIFVKHDSGALFCSTQDLELVRPEVSYLRYGLMVRHTIGKKSPLYGHTMETLLEGDASFSLTVMGIERASLQPVFHLEDYFVYDGDVLWDADYADFIHTNEKGQRVLDHSKINEINPLQTSGVTRSKNTPKSKSAKSEQNVIGSSNSSGGNKQGTRCFLWKTWMKHNTNKHKLWKSKSTSFTPDG